MKYSKFFNKFYYPDNLNVTLGLGVSAYRGDICGRPQCNSFFPSFSIGANLKPLPILGFGLESTFLILEAVQYKEKTNILAFKSTVVDLMGYIRIYIVDDIIKSPQDRKREYRRIKPYILLGLNTYYYHPKSNYLNETRKNEASEKTNYPAIGAGGAVGGGLNLFLTPRLSLSGEGKHIFAFTDFIDDIGGNRGNSKNFPDTYLTALLKLQITLGK